MKSKVIFIHGFGVSKFSRGIFTDIEKFWDQNIETEFIYTDLNIIENKDGKENITIKTPQEQAKIVEEVISSEVVKDFENKIKVEYIFITHSMGCVVSTLLDKSLIPENTKFIFLAPPILNNVDKGIENYKLINPKNIIDIEKTSELHRRDGSITFIPKEFWQARKDLDFLENYKSLSTFLKENNFPKLSIIIAKQDEVIENNEDILNQFKTLSNISEINGNHNFDNERESLAKKILEIVQI